MLVLLGVIIGRELIVISLILRFILGGKLGEVLEIMTVMASLELTKKGKVFRKNFVVEVRGWGS